MLSKEIQGLLISELKDTNISGLEYIPIEKDNDNYKISISDLTSYLSRYITRTVVAFRKSTTQPHVPVDSYWDLSLDDIVFSKDSGWSDDIVSLESVSVLSDIKEYISSDYCTIDGYVPRYCAYGCSGQNAVGTSVNNIKKSFTDALGRSTNRSFCFIFSQALMVASEEDGFAVLEFDLSKVCTCSTSDKLKSVHILTFSDGICVASCDLKDNGSFFTAQGGLNVKISGEQLKDIDSKSHDSFAVVFEATLDGSIEAINHTETNAFSNGVVSFTSRGKAAVPPIWMSVGYFKYNNPQVPKWTLPIRLG